MIDVTVKLISHITSVATKKTPFLEKIVVDAEYEKSESEYWTAVKPMYVTYVYVLQTMLPYTYMHRYASVLS